MKNSMAGRLTVASAVVAALVVCAATFAAYSGVIGGDALIAIYSLVLGGVLTVHSTLGGAAEVADRVIEKTDQQNTVLDEIANRVRAGKM